MSQSSRRAAPSAAAAASPVAPPQPESAARPASSGRPRGLYAIGEGSAARVRVQHLREMKARGQRIAAVTCYDATFARLVDAAGIDVVLVGDSLGNVIQGHDTTLPVTVDHIVYHTAAVARGLQRAHLVADMPFMSYRSPDVALQNAGRMLAEGGAHAVKLEGGKEVADTVRALVSAGIPVMGHIGLTPQSVHAMGGNRVQGRGRAARERLVEAALALEEAGCYTLVLEGIPSELAAIITAELTIPTIGIGAGPDCDGQILVLYDLLGLNPGFKPKFLKQYAALGDTVVDALATYRAEVQAVEFPAAEHGYVDPTLAAEPHALPSGA
jgi:3-methyl-2-oxobutanoate hydroxymethyltransferase